MRLLIALLLGIGIVNGQDTTIVYFEPVFLTSIGHTDSSYSNGSYKLVNEASDTIIVDMVTKINYNPIFVEGHNYNGDYINFDIIKFHVGIGKRVFNQYPIYYYDLDGVRTYIEGASLIPYKPFDYLMDKPKLKLKEE